MKSGTVAVIFVVVVFGGLGLAIVLSPKEQVDWPTMNYVCSGYGSSDNPAGYRCERTSLPNIKDNIDRFYYFCPEHYRQSDWIKKAEERPVEQDCGEPNEPKSIKYDDWNTFWQKRKAEVEDCSEPNEVQNLNCSHVSGYCTLCRKPEEPNEPVTWSWTGTTKEGQQYIKVLLGMIPIAPDYIELPKDLVILTAYCEDSDDSKYYNTIKIAKGTRIYFEENP